MGRYQRITLSMLEGAKTRKEQQLQALGLEKLSKEQAIGIARSFGGQVRAKLEGHPSSLAVIPTLLQPVDKARLHAGDQSLVVEVGGTHFRSSIVTVDSEKNPQLTTETLAPERKKKYDSTDEFFDELARSVKDVIGEANPKALGIIWSFPADIVSVSSGIDAVSTDKLTKELDVPGINTRKVGDFIIDGLRRNGISIPIDLPRAVVNDTAAVLLANGAALGGIVATGFNLAFLHEGQMYNLEAGGFDVVPQTALTQIIDKVSEHPGHYPLEKQVSGDYVGQAFSLVLKELGVSDKNLTSADMSAVLAGELFNDNPTAKEVATILRDRSAQLVGAAIAGTIQEFREDFPVGEIVIPIDGSFFGKTPGYKEALEFYATDLLDGKKKIVTKYVQESGMKGAGIAALGLVR